ncbi:hypothetical protein CVU83_00935 [Candidatus Falkowbacteria bacterium HGW-Falkowbacteria-2]|uniref:Septum formation initiator n=1 Tax=Candidatus Falkowbacteria bacterium HGW-Falkowbacteria-2 TaxID=2013769 RepID=A0A2N2E2I6_9BACT|nr:MAG: hypothetical protein CVU83_00935 [Candidatus Falkowbacteria bacterium HGW-Falkowbacteria-2]
MAKIKNISSYKQTRRPQGSFVARLLGDKRVFAIIALIFLLLILVPLAKSYSRKRLIEKEIEGIQQEIASFEAKNSDLKEMIDYLQSDQSLEEQARLNMGLKRPGETVAVIADSVVGVQVAETKEVVNPPNWQKWWRYFAE